MARNSLEENLRNLSKIYAPSRSERPAAEYMERALKDCVDTSTIDDMNNYVGIKRGKNAKKTILIDAHVDEVTRANPETIVPKKTGNVFSGKAMDDRSGCAAMIAVAKELSSTYDDLNVIYVGASREELGMRGATRIAEELKSEGTKIDLAIALDVIDCYKEKKRSNKLGEGVSIMRKPGTGDGAREADAKALDLCYDVAANYGGKHQVSNYGWQGDVWTTDAKPYHDIAKAPVLVVSIPCLNMHGYSKAADLRPLTGGTAVEKIDMRDLADTVKFTTDLVKAYARTTTK